MLKPETELEWRLLGLLAALLGVASKEFAASACRAAELDAEEIISLVRNDPNRRFSCTMWNLCNDAIGVEMLSHEEIRSKMKEGGDAGVTWREDKSPVVECPKCHHRFVGKTQEAPVADSLLQRVRLIQNFRAADDPEQTTDSE